MSRHCDNCETEIISNTEFYSIAVYSVVDEPTKGGEVKHLDEVDELCWRCGEELFSLAGLHPFTKGKITKTQEEPDSPAKFVHRVQLNSQVTDCGIDISSLKKDVNLTRKCPQCFKKTLANLGTDSKSQRLVDDIIDGIIDISQ